MTEKVLVTGGAGYVGSHACKALANAGYLPVFNDNLSTRNRCGVRWGPLEIGDIRDELAARRPGDPAELGADPAAMKALFGDGLTARSSLEQILATAWDWHARFHRAGGAAASVERMSRSGIGP